MFFIRSPREESYLRFAPAIWGDRHCPSLPASRAERQYKGECNVGENWVEDFAFARLGSRRFRNPVERERAGKPEAGGSERAICTRGKGITDRLRHGYGEAAEGADGGTACGARAAGEMRAPNGGPPRKKALWKRARLGRNTGALATSDSKSKALDLRGRRRGAKAGPSSVCRRLSVRSFSATQLLRLSHP